MLRLITLSLLVCTFTLFSHVQLFSHEWDKGLQKFSLGMTISEVETILLSYKKGFRQAESYSSINHYFVKSTERENFWAYFNDDLIQVRQNSFSDKNFLKGDVILKKIFGYKLGMNKWMAGEQVFSEKNNTQHYPFNPRMTYLYRSFPVKNVNGLLISAELGFYNKRLFRILYKVQFTTEEKDYFIKHIKEKYKKGYQGKTLLVQKAGVKITINQVNENEMIYYIEYKSIALETEYKKYIEEILDIVKRSIDKAKFIEIEEL